MHFYIHRGYGIKTSIRRITKTRRRGRWTYQVTIQIPEGGSIREEKESRSSVVFYSRRKAVEAALEHGKCLVDERCARSQD